MIENINFESQLNEILYPQGNSILVNTIVLQKILTYILNFINKNYINKKIAKRPEQTLLQKQHTDGQQTHGQTLNITDHLRSAS